MFIGISNVSWYLVIEQLNLILVVSSQQTSIVPLLKSAKILFRLNKLPYCSKEGKRGEFAQGQWGELHCLKGKAKSTDFLKYFA